MLREDLGSRSQTVEDFDGERGKPLTAGLKGLQLGIRGSRELALDCYV